MKSKNAFYSLLTIILFSVLLISCKKDQLKVDETKTYAEIGHVASGPYDGGWSLSLNPDKTGELLPGGDIVYRITYKISGNKIKAKDAQNDDSFTFDIISENEIKETKYGVRMGLVRN